MPSLRSTMISPRAALFQACVLLLALLAGDLGLSTAAPPVTFDFRSTANGGNVGDAFNGQRVATVAVGGLSLTGRVSAPDAGRREFSFNDGSADLGIGVRSDAGTRNTQIDPLEEVRFNFDRTVAVNSITLQVFFLSTSDGQGGPVSPEGDKIDLALGGNTIGVASPLNFSPPNPSTYTIDVSTLGFASTHLAVGDALRLAPTAGDGVRLQSITVQEIPEPASVVCCGLCVAALARLGRQRRRRLAAERQPVI